MRVPFARVLVGLPTLVVLPTLFVLTLFTFAQFSQRGVVMEASGAVLLKASVTLVDLGRNQTSTTLTDSSGHYEFSQLLPDEYQVSVELAGFKKSVSDHLTVSPQAPVRCAFCGGKGANQAVSMIGNIEFSRWGRRLSAIN